MQETARQVCRWQPLGWARLPGDRYIHLQLLDHTLLVFTLIYLSQVPKLITVPVHHFPTIDTRSDA